MDTSGRPAGALANPAQLAREALGALAVVVVDETGPEPRLVVSDGLVGEPALRLHRRALEGEEPGVHRTPIEWDGQPLGAVSVLARPEAPNPPDGTSPLVQSFARHMAVTMAYGRLGAPPESEITLDFASVDELTSRTWTFTEMLRRLHEAIEEAIGARLTAISVWDEKRDVLQFLPGSFRAPNSKAHSYQIPNSNVRSNGARVFRTGRPYMSNDARADPGILQSYVEVFDISNALSVPLTADDRRVGVLHLANKPTDFTIEDMAAVERLAPRVALAVEFRRSVLKLYEQQKLEAALVSAATAIAAGRSARAWVRPTFREIAVALDVAMMALTFPGAQQLSHKSAMVTAELERGFLARAAEGGEQSRTGGEAATAGDPGWADLHVPVTLQGERIATLSILRTRHEPLTDSQLDGVGRLAELTALAWGSERYQHQRAELARLRERQRIADDLHDRVAQILYAAQLGLDSVLERDGLAPADAERIADARGLLVRGDREIREVIHQLSPVSSDGIVERIAATVESVGADFDVPIRLEVAPALADRLEDTRPVWADSFVRAGREAMVNAAKHAGPCRITVSLAIRDSIDRRVLLTVVDDGIGRARDERQARQGHGIEAVRRSIVEHGGRLRVSRRQPVGTTVTVSMPL